MKFLIFVYHSVQRLQEKKIDKMKYLAIIGCLLITGPVGVLGKIPGSHPIVPGSNLSVVFHLFFNIHPFLLLFRDFYGAKRGAYTTIYQWDQVQSTRILLYFYQN